MFGYRGCFVYYLKKVYAEHKRRPKSIVVILSAKRSSKSFLNGTVPNIKFNISVK